MSAWPEGYGRHVFDRVETTLAEAARLAPGLTGPAWIIAAEQTAARGRRGRAWATPRGNFAGTLVLQRRESPGVAALRSFGASLALFRTFSAVTGQPDAFALKWPNDVLLRDGKVAGILLESIGAHLVIGIGVNLAHAPDADTVEPGALIPRSLTGDLGVMVTPEAFLEVLAAEYAHVEDLFVSQGFAPVRQAWLAHAARRGQRITARTMRDSWTGIFEDVDETGALILQTDDGRRAITAADVFF